MSRASLFLCLNTDTHPPKRTAPRNLPPRESSVVDSARVKRPTSTAAARTSSSPVRAAHGQSEKPMPCTLDGPTESGG